MEKTKSIRRFKVGRVISDKTAKTIKVEFEGMYQHPKYKKYLKRVSSCLVHDPDEKCSVGDLVRIEETKPVSKLKKWIVFEILEHAKKGLVEEQKEKGDDTAGINS